MRLMQLSSLAGIVGALLVLPVIAVASVPPGAPALARVLKVPRTLAPGEHQTAVLAGGCFWGLEAVFEHVRGVKQVESGYAGGPAAMASYEAVSSGTTGHAEAVRIRFDPAQVSYRQLLKVYFTVAHDPTELNRQGPDVGTQYRSVIFTLSPEQERQAREEIKAEQASGRFPAPIVTEVVPAAGFYPAEPYHQNFIDRHPTNPYVVINDLPKLAQLRQRFPDLYQQAVPGGGAGDPLQ